jgi:hypothetical protein
MGHPKPTKVGIPGFWEHTKTAGQEILTAFAGVIELRRVLAAFQNEPPGASKAARDLSDQESFALLMHLVYQGEITLLDKIRTDAAGRIVQPRPGQQLTIKARLGGVEFQNALNASLDYFLPKPVLAIALYRLATRLSGGYYAAKQIVWGGIGHGHEGKALNCHEVGTCVDIYGALTRFGKFDVYKDWGSRPVFKTDGKQVHAAHGDPWGDATSTYYRLRSSEDGLKYYFFQELYRAGREQFTVAPTDNLDLEEGKPVRQGANIFHPDYPALGLRRSHQEHVHFQIGPSYL